MSNVYNLEPPTKGKVVLRTSLGDLDVELWAKEAPKAVRNFVQLCLEGYYDGTIFHRVLKDFMAQGGDPSGTGEGGESIYGRPFKDEVHSRLRFSHRGLLACANRNEPDTNGSQFFITLDATPQLERKYTIFGRVAGDTMYNLLRFNDLEVDGDDRPEHPPVLKRADVLWNPFEDIVPRIDREARDATAAAEAAAAAAATKASRCKAAKNFSLISFGDEAEAEDEEATEAAATLRIASAHDALEDATLSKEAALEVDLNKVREAMRAARQHAEEKPGGSAASGPGLEERMRERVQARRERQQQQQELTGEGPGAPAAPTEGQGREASKRSGAQESSSGSDDEEEEERPAKKVPRLLAGTGKGQKSSAAVVVPSRQIAVADADLLTQWEQKRKEYREKKRIGGHRQKDTLAKLQRFNANLHSAAPKAAPAVEAAPDAAAPAEPAASLAGGAEAGYDGKVRKDIDHAAYMPAAWRVDAYLGEGDGGEESDDDLASLRQHRLAFAKDARDAMSRKESVDDYTVHDPLLEAGKAKFSKRSQAEKKRGNQWAGRANV